MVKLFHIKIRKISFCHNSSVKVNNPHPPPPKCHIDVKRGNLSMDVTPNKKRQVSQKKRTREHTFQPPSSSRNGRFVINPTYILGVAPWLWKLWILDSLKAWKVHSPGPIGLQSYPYKVEFSIVFARTFLNTHLTWHNNTNFSNSLFNFTALFMV